MASAIACACDEMAMDSTSLWMCHLPWTMTMGNSVDLRKEAEVLDQYRDALVAIYRTKFDTTDEVLIKMCETETWICGKDAPLFNLKCEVIPTDAPLKIAASGKMPKFMHTPKALREILMEKEAKERADLTNDTSIEESNMENKEETKTVEQEQVEKTEVEQTKVETPVEDTKVEDKKIEEEQPVEEEMVAKAEVDKRVSGMQSAMAKQMDAMKKDYEAKIADFEVQIKAKDEELKSARADITSLTQTLDNTTKELAEMTSAFKEKADALATLNASVNTPNEIDSKEWKKLKGKEFFAWYAKNH